jgi:hypothetical protein
MTEKGAKKGTITNKEIKRLTSKVLTRNDLYTRGGIAMDTGKRKTMLQKVTSPVRKRGVVR